MKKVFVTMLFMALALAMVGSAVAQPPEGGPPGRERGPRGDRPGRGGPPIMAALDADKDGTLSADEIENASDALKLLDKNDDGKLTREELGPPHGPGGPDDFRRGPRGDGPRGDGPPPGRRGRGDGAGDERRGPRRRGPDDFERDGRGPRDFGPPDGPPGDRPPRRGPQDGEARGPRVLPPGTHEELDLSAEQVAKIEALEKEVKTRIEEILEPEQLERLARVFRRGPGGPGGPGGRGRFGPRADGPDGPPPPRD